MLQMTEMQLLSSFFYHNLGKEPASQSDCSCNLGLQIEWSFLPGQMLCCVPGLDTILKVLPATLEHIMGYLLSLSSHLNEGFILWKKHYFTAGHSGPSQVGKIQCTKISPTWLANTTQDSVYLACSQS